jgi:primosomal protein N' (replication factor Y)
MRVAVLLPNHLNQCFDYAVPMDVHLGLGDHVQVSFNGREMIGVVWEAPTAVDESRKLKPILSQLTHVPPMSNAMREFIEWVAWYTAAPLGAALRMALPVKLTEPLRQRRKVTNNKKTPPPSLAALDADQQHAADQLCASVSNGFSTTLLDGVTGSGKTEVYFAAVASAISKGKQALILLPEIALSIQWLERFEARFGFMPEVWHSNVSPAKKRDTYLKLARGEASVVVGARSALFLPFHTLGIIVVDEEHDGSYKQEDGVMYHARDMAVIRAKKENAPIILASATPSVESWHNAKQGKYKLISLSKRYSDASMPDIALIDLRRDPPERGEFLSMPIRRAMAEALARGEQSLLFLNRRGYAPLMLCRKCGHRFACTSCSSWMVMHKGAKKLSCHHCGKEERLPEICPSCNTEDCLHACGPGVERIVEEVKHFLPEARIGCLSSDGEENSSLADIIHAMQEGTLDVLVGTQMVAKGHHFEKLSLVGVVDADLGLAGGDLRAMERTYQLLHQISGRAGRAHIKGQALVQTFSPEHPALQALVSDDREKFMQQELQSRKIAHMPPFTRLLAVIIESHREDEVANVARMMASHFPSHAKARLYGPAPAPLYRLRNWFRWRMLVVADRELKLQSLADEWQSRVKLPLNIKCKWDVDPYSFL